MTTSLADRSGHSAIAVSGPDATSFLQSLVSQDIEGLGDGDGASSLLLTPQGKLGLTLRLLRVGDEWWLDCEAGFGEQLVSALSRYRIRVDAEIRDRSDEWGLIEVRGSDAVARVATAAQAEVPDAYAAHVAWGAGRIVRADWPDRPGVDVLGPRDAVKEARAALLDAGVDPFGPGAYEAARIEAGVPRLGVDLDERTIPQEAFLERDAVSFTKGCFLGQELVCRIDTRGHVNRYLRLVRTVGDTVPASGAEVLVDDRSVGHVTSAAAVPGESRAVALAMVRRELEPPVDVRLRWDGEDVSATVEVLPTSGS